MKRLMGFKKTTISEGQRPCQANAWRAAGDECLIGSGGLTAEIAPAPWPKASRAGVAPWLVIRGAQPSLRFLRSLWLTFRRHHSVVRPERITLPVTTAMLPILDAACERGMLRGACLRPQRDRDSRHGTGRSSMDG